MSIVLGDILPGDRVTILDPASHGIATGYANIDAATSSMWIRAFGTRIYFAKQNKAGWHRTNELDVVEHQAPLPIAEK